MKAVFFIGATAVCALSATIASAQELLSDCQCDPCCACDSFDGWYVGGNLGVLSHLANRNDQDGFLTDNSGWSTSDTDIALGVQVGHDWQCGHRVVGWVVDWNGTGAGDLLRDNPGAPDENAIKSDLEWFTTFRGRAGIELDDALFYISAGPAIAGVETVWSDPPDQFGWTDTRFGWAGSVGTEFMMSHNLSLGAELMYLNLGDERRTFPDTFGSNTVGGNDSAWTGRFLLNYRFGR